MINRCRSFRLRRDRTLSIDRADPPGATAGGSRTMSSFGKLPGADLASNRTLGGYAKMKNRLPDSALDQLFRDAHTAHGFRPEPVSDELLHDLHELLKWGPTSSNCQPARFVFVRSAGAKERLRPALSPGNVAQTMAAPVTVIVATDTRFFEHLPTQFPAYDAKSVFANNPELARETGLRNGSLQGAYLILAARALGLDCGPMSGFDAAALDAEFFPDGRLRSNFLVNIGTADPAKYFPRGPRLTFATAAQIL